MEFTLDWHNYVPTLLSGLIYAYLIYCGIKWRMLQEFQAFYFYLIVSSLASMANWTAIALWGYGSLAYMYVYFAGYAGKLTGEFLLLAAIFERVRRPAGAVRFLPLLVMAATAASILLLLPYRSLWQISIMPLLGQGMLLTLIWVHGLRKRSIMGLGLNWSGLLMGLSLGILLKGGHAAASQMTAAPSYDNEWRIYLQAIEFAPWVVFALTMGRRDSLRISRQRRDRRPADRAAAGRSTAPRTPAVSEFEMIRRAR